MIPVAEHIFKECRQGKRLSQQQLYEHCYDDMIKLCLRYCVNYVDAASLYNESMFKVFDKIGSLKEQQSLMGWIRRIVVNTCVDNCRKKVKYAIHRLEQQPEITATIEPDIYSKISAAETMDLIRELPLNTSLVFNLFVMEGYKHDEIATMLAISSGTSKWHLNEARRLLKAKLEILSKTKTYSNVI